MSSIKKRKINGRTVWRVRWCDGFKPDGSVLQREKTFSTRAEAVKFDAEVHVAKTNGTYSAPTDMKLSQWLEIWETDYLPVGRKPSTVRLYHNMIVRIKKEIGHIKLINLKADVLQKYYADMAKSGKTFSIRDTFDLLKMILNDAVMAEKISVNPLNRIKIARPKRKETVTPTNEQLEKLINEFQKDKFAGVEELMLCTGLRISEALGITLDEIDLNNRTLTIRHQLQRIDGTFSLVPTKTSSERIIPLTENIINIIKRERRLQFLRAQECGELWENNLCLLFTDEIGDPILQSTLSAHVKRCGLKVGIDIHPHTLRHIFTTKLITSGADIKSVQALLGHANPDLTLGTYAHTTELAKRTAMEKLDEAYLELQKSV